MKTLLLSLLSISSLYAQTELPVPVETPILSSSTTNFSSASELQFSQLPPPNLMPTTQKNPLLAVSLSVIPGLGHVYLNDMKTATTLFSTASIEAALAFNPQIQDPRTKNFSFFALTATLGYALYSAYRDARIYNGLSNYSYKMPTDDFADLSFAPFRWSVIKKPEVWGGVLGILVGTTTLMYFAYPHNTNAKVLSASSTSIWPPIALPVGVSEEAYFRGFFQSFLSDMYGSPAGLIGSSLLFAAAHRGNAKQFPHSERWRYYAFSLPLIGAIGAYCGWLTEKNRSLQSAVAFHTWYDFILFSVAALAQKETAAIGRPVNFALAIPF